MPTIGSLRCRFPVEPKYGVPNTEDTTVGRNQPIPAWSGVRGHPDDRLVEMQAGGRAMKPGAGTELGDRAVSGREPVATTVG